MPPERIQSPRGLRNFIDSNIRDSVIQSAFRSDIGRNLEVGKISAALSLLDKSFSQEFGEYFGHQHQQRVGIPRGNSKKVSIRGRTNRHETQLNLSVLAARRIKFNADHFLR